MTVQAHYTHNKVPLDRNFIKSGEEEGGGVTRPLLEPAPEQAFGRRPAAAKTKRQDLSLGLRKTRHIFPDPQVSRFVREPSI